MKKATTPSRNADAGAKPRGGLPLALLLKLQLFYCLAGMGYNLVSLVLSKTGGSPLSPTDPVMGMVVLAVYGGCLLVGRLGYERIYRVLMGLSVLVLGYGGVVMHLVNFAAGHAFLYASTAAWVLAVAINLFGLVLNFIGALGLFTGRGK